MLIRISLILAVVAALAVGAVNFFVVKDKINTLVTDRNTNRDGWHATQAALSKTNEMLVKTQDAQADPAGFGRHPGRTRQGRGQRRRSGKTRHQLADKLAKTTQERDDIQNQLAAYKATGLTADRLASWSTPSKIRRMWSKWSIKR